jgi:hypothetical protein
MQFLTAPYPLLSPILPRTLPDELGSRAVGLLEGLLALLAGESLSAAKLLKALELLAGAQQVGHCLSVSGRGNKSGPGLETLSHCEPAAMHSIPLSAQAACAAVHSCHQTSQSLPSIVHFNSLVAHISVDTLEELLTLLPCRGCSAWVSTMRARTGCWALCAQPCVPIPSRPWPPSALTLCRRCLDA